MNREIHRYSFKTSVPGSEIEETLHLAVLAAEGLYGQSRVHIDAGYFLDAEKRACVIDAGSDVGRDISRIFGGYALREFGEGAFDVNRVDTMPSVEAGRVRHRGEGCSEGCHHSRRSHPDKRYQRSEDHG